jgi:hypothetical protein
MTESEDEDPENPEYFTCKNYATCGGVWEDEDELCHTCKEAASTTAAKRIRIIFRELTLPVSSTAVVAQLPGPSTNTIPGTVGATSATAPELNFRLRAIEVVGIGLGNYGRQCGLHAICGVSLAVGEQLKLVSTVLKLMTEEDVEVEIPVPQVAVPTEDTFIRKNRGRKPKPKTRIEKQIISRYEDVVEARRWCNASVGCLIGFVSKAFVTIYGKGLNGRIVEVTDICSKSEFETDRIRSELLNGIARVVILQ